LSTDSLVLRLQKNSGTAKPTRKINDDEIDDEFEPEELEEGEEAPARKAPAARTRATANKRPTGLSAQVDDLLQKNWTQARGLGMNPPNISVDQFVRQTQSKVGEPKPGVARVLSAVQKLSKKDVLITPNLAADEIIETDELR